MLYRRKKIDYTTPSGHEGGPEIGRQITPYVGTPYINMTAAQFRVVATAIGARIGDTWTLGGTAPALGGNTFQFVRTRQALTIGTLVTACWPTGTVGANAIYGDQDAVTVTVPGVPATTTAAVTTNYNNVGLVAANGDIDNWIFVNATGATLPQLRRIKANTASATAVYTVALTDFMRPNNPTDADVFDTLATNGNPAVIIRPHEVMLCTDTLTPMGVALGTVTAGNYTIIQIGGLANVLSDGDGLNEALVVNQPAWTAAGGAIRGANGVASLFTAAGEILPQMASAVDIAGGVLLPCFINFTAQ